MLRPSPPLISRPISYIRTHNNPARPPPGYPHHNNPARHLPRLASSQGSHPRQSFPRLPGQPTTRSPHPISFHGPHRRQSSPVIPRPTTSHVSPVSQVPTVPLIKEAPKPQPVQALLEYKTQRHSYSLALQQAVHYEPV